MKVSYNWLKEFTDIRETPQQLRTRFTNLGLAVDALESHGEDSLFELDVPSNRPDCLSHFGVAREASVVYGSPLVPPKFQLQQGDKYAREVFSISIADPDLCARARSQCVRQCGNRGSAHRQQPAGHRPAHHFKNQGRYQSEPRYRSALPREHDGHSRRP